VEVSIAGACTIIDASPDDSMNAVSSCTLTTLIIDESIDYFARVITSGLLNHESRFGLLQVTGFGGDLLFGNFTAGELLFAPVGSSSPDLVLGLLRLG
jgi:hypothetical protein